MHTVVADNMVLIYSPKSSEAFEKQMDSITAVVGKDATSDVELLLSDNPVALDYPHKLRAVAKDQLHPALKAEKCLGKKQRNAFTVALRRCMRKFGNAHDDGMPYYVKGREISSTVDLTQTARDMNARQAKHRAVCIDNGVFITLMYKHGNDFVTDGAALTRVRSHEKTRTQKGGTTVCQCVIQQWAAHASAVTGIVAGSKLLGGALARVPEGMTESAWEMMQIVRLTRCRLHMFVTALLPCCHKRNSGLLWQPCHLARMLLQGSGSFA